MPTRKTKAADRGRGPALVITGRHAPLSVRAVVGAVELVLGKERRSMGLTVNFIGPRAMRALNKTWKQIDQPTDVLTFSMADPVRGPVGDCYVCPAVARSNAKVHGVPLREELLRLIIHAILHALGHDHPEGDGRTRSSMWRKQERYLACVI